jgi:hypothetical protein
MTFRLLLVFALSILPGIGHAADCLSDNSGLRDVPDCSGLKIVTGLLRAAER